MKVCWNITSRCNKNCRYCFKFEEKELSLEENKKILKNLIDRKVERIAWSGGEPFLYDGLKELLKIAKENNVLNYVNTNATILNEDNLKENIEYVDRLIISLDFIDEELNKKYEIGENYFEHLKKILKLVKKVKPNIEIKINTVVFKGNLNKLEELYQELLNYDIDCWKLIRFFPVRGKALRELSLDVTDEEFAQVVKDFSNRQQNFKIVIHGHKEMGERHIIVCGSGEIIYSENGKDIIVEDRLL